MAICKVEQDIGYTQGMNFIAATLLYHSDETICFYLLQTLLSDYGLKEVY